MDLSAVLVVVVATVSLLAVPSPTACSPLASQENADALGQNSVDGYLAEMPSSQLREVTEALVELVRKDPWKDNRPPLVFIEPATAEAAPQPRDDQDDDQDDEQDEGRVSQPGPGPDPDEFVELLGGLAPPHKRSRYYRRYPWKRVTRTRGAYDPDQYNMCSPSREDVIQLLVGLHRAKEGDYGRTIQFCNRKRPASSVFTNIRFIG